MIWNVCFIIGLACLLASAATAVIYGKKKHKRPVITPLRLLFVGFFCTTFVAVFPVCYLKFAGTPFSVVKSIVSVIQTTPRFFAFAVEPTLVFDSVPAAAGMITPFYTALLAVVFFADPVFTFGFLLYFFKNASAYIRLFIKRRKDLYVFSELNEKSLTLAADIKKNHPKSAVVFTGVFEKGKDETNEKVIRAKSLGCICFKKDIFSVNLKIHNPSAQLFLFAIAGDESDNIRKSLVLIKKYGNVPNSRLYVFSTDIESELLLSHSGDIPMKVRRVNEIQSLVYNLLYEQGGRLFRNAVPTENGDKKIHAVIVGMEGYGTEMLKALAWYCQMDGYRIEIDAYDKDGCAEERFSALCPELISEDYNGVFVPGEAEYLIRIHSGFEIDTAAFANSIESMEDVTYAFVALGTDGDNVKAAAELRMLFERSKSKPVIHTVVKNSNKKAMFEKATNFRGQSYAIECIGDLESSCSERVIISSELEATAFLVHKGYCNGSEKKESEFWQYEYNYRSSMASALHMDARVKCGIAGANKAADQWTDEEKALHEMLEHRRWNAYMRGCGYIFSGSVDAKSRNDLAKVHHDLVDFSSLSDEEKRKDSHMWKYKNPNDTES